MPYVNEFQKRFKGITYVACSWSDLFDYPNLTYIPNKSKKVLDYLGIDSLNKTSFGQLKVGTKTYIPKNLFPKIDPS